MKIVVTTPTGHVGSRVLRLLIQAGVRPTALVRDASRLEPELRRFCDVVEGKQEDEDAVLRATFGADALYWVDPPSDDDDPLDGYERFGETAAAAVTANAVPRVVFQSSVGAEVRSGFGEVDGLARTEELLNGTGAHVTHLRCGYFFTNLLTDLDSIRSGVLISILPVGHRMPWVDPRDIGEVAVARLLATDWHGRRTLGVHGPQDLSLREVAAIVGAAVGRPLAAEQISETEYAGMLRGAGLTEARIEGILGMSRGQLDFTPEDPRSLMTSTPTSLAAWAYDVLRPALNSQS